MKYAKFIQALNNKPVAIEPDAHRAILAAAESMIAGDFNIADLFDDVPPVYEERGNVAVINISGVILPSCSKIEKMLGCCSLKEIRSAIKQAKASQVENVIFNINSPGGTVQGVKETAKAINDLNQSKDTLAYTSDQMCSAAYWLGAQCKSVIASESASVGSIGVYLAVLTMEKGLAMQGVEANVIQAGKYKTLGIACKDLTAEEIAYLQEGVNECYADFTAAVEGRGLADTTMQGEVYEGDKVLSLGLVDAFQADLSDLISFLQ